MTDGNGTAPAEPVLAGHVVIYPDMVAFRPDGGGDEDVIHRPVKGRLGSGGIEAFIQFLSPGNGGQLAFLLGSGIDGLNPAKVMQAMNSKGGQQRGGRR